MLDANIGDEMEPNFDNLVEDAEKLGAVKYNGVLIIAPEKIKVLLTQYILADRAQGQEPTVYRKPNTDASFDSFGNGEDYRYSETGFFDGDDIEPLFTHAQPTPAQIADAQIDILRKAARVLLARISLSYDDILSHAESTNYDDVRLAASDTESDACANALLDLVDKLRKGEPL